MTEEELRQLKSAIQRGRETLLIALQCGMPPSLQEIANAEWAVLARKYGFNPATPIPAPGKGERFFLAEPLPEATKKGIEE